VGKPTLSILNDLPRVRHHNGPPAPVVRPSELDDLPLVLLQRPLVDQLSVPLNQGHLLIVHQPVVALHRSQATSPMA